MPEMKTKTNAQHLRHGIINKDFAQPRHVTINKEITEPICGKNTIEKTPNSRQREKHLLENKKLVIFHIGETNKII